MARNGCGHKKGTDGRFEVRVEPLPRTLGPRRRAPLVRVVVRPLRPASRPMPASGAPVAQEPGAVDKEGRVSWVSVVKDLPLGLGREAVRAVERWRFDPATVNGKPVAETIEITVHFAAPKSQRLQVSRKLIRPSCGPLTADHEPRTPVSPEVRACSVACGCKPPPICATNCCRAAPGARPEPLTVSRPVGFSGAMAWSR